MSGKEFTVKSMTSGMKYGMEGFSQYDIDECLLIADGDHEDDGILKIHTTLLEKESIQSHIDTKTKDLREVQDFYQKFLKLQEDQKLNESTINDVKSKVRDKIVTITKDIVNHQLLLEKL